MHSAASLVRIQCAESDMMSTVRLVYREISPASLESQTAQMNVNCCRWPAVGAIPARACPHVHIHSSSGDGGARPQAVESDSAAAVSFSLRKRRQEIKHHVLAQHHNARPLRTPTSAPPARNSSASPHADKDMLYFAMVYPTPHIRNHTCNVSQPAHVYGQKC